MCQKNGAPVFFQSREAERFFVLRTKILISCVLKVTEQSGVSLEIPNCPCFFWRVPPFLKVTQQYGFFADFKPLSNIVFIAIFAQKVNVISIVGDTPGG